MDSKTMFRDNHTHDGFSEEIIRVEEDMRMHYSKDPLKRLFSSQALIGNVIASPKLLIKLTAKARKTIDNYMNNPTMTITMRSQMEITLAMINHAKNWSTEENSSLWQYLTLQFGYRDSDQVINLMKDCLEQSLKQNRRLFFMRDKGRRAFKSTILIHALSTKRSWMVLFDFLFDFYKNNLKWEVIPHDPLIGTMVHALGQKLSDSGDDDIELMISSQVYAFQEGICKLVLYRPLFTQRMFEKLIKRIHSLVNSEGIKANTYDEVLCEEWFKEKIISISNSRKTVRQSQGATHDIAIDYEHIRPKYVLKNENQLQIVIPDIRLKNENFQNARLVIRYNGDIAYQQRMTWYGNELGKTLNGISVLLPELSVSNTEINTQVQLFCDEEMIYDSENSLERKILFFSGSTEISAGQIKRDNYTMIVPSGVLVKTEKIRKTEIDPFVNRGFSAHFVELDNGYIITVNGKLIAFDSENGSDIKVLQPIESNELPCVTINDTEASFAYRSSVCTIILGNIDFVQQFILLKDGERIEFSSLLPSENGLAFTCPLNDNKYMTRLQVLDLASERLLFDKTYILIDRAKCAFNLKFYYSTDDYSGAVYKAVIDDFLESVSFSESDTEIKMPFMAGELHTEIPRIILAETTGWWNGQGVPSVFFGDISQNSIFKINAPQKADIRFFAADKDIMYDGKGIVTIGNVLYSMKDSEGLSDALVEMKVNYDGSQKTYPLAHVYFKERFLMKPQFRTEGNKLYWDHGGGFIGKSERIFTLKLSDSDDNIFEFKMDENTEYVEIPQSMPIGNYRYEICIQSGGLFRKVSEVIASGDCIIGDKNLLRFKDRRIVIDSITDAFKEEAGHIELQTCYIDKITFNGIEETSEGLCPVYSGILYRENRYGERHEFSREEYTNKRGFKKMPVNPVRVVFINDTALCVTDREGDGLYYYSYFDKNSGSVRNVLTDQEYTKENKKWYSNADLYLYRTEGI